MIASLGSSSASRPGSMTASASRRRPAASLYDLAAGYSESETEENAADGVGARPLGAQEERPQSRVSSGSEDADSRSQRQAQVVVGSGNTFGTPNRPPIGEALVERYAEIRRDLRRTTRYKAEELLADLYDDKILLEKELKRAMSQQEIYSIMRKLKANEDLSSEIQKLLEVSLAAEESGTAAAPSERLTESEAYRRSSEAGAVATYPFQYSGPAGPPGPHNAAGAAGPTGLTGAAGNAGSSLTPQSFLRTHALIFSPHAAKAFNASRGVIKVACPQSLYVADASYSYVGSVVEPLLIVGTTLFDLEMLPELRASLARALFVRETGNLLSPFERNLLWAILTFVVFKNPEILFKHCPKSVLQDATFLLPCEPAMRPVYALAEATLYLPNLALKSYGVATVAVPYYDDRPALPRATRVEKVASFQKRMHFNYSGLKECLDRCIKCLRRHVQDGCGHAGAGD